ncbi:MAG: hypothetical protein U0996_08250 [Planctomycetaceae bacterium]
MQVPLVRAGLAEEQDGSEPQGVLLKASVIATSPTAVSIFSSLTFHLAVLAFVLILLPLLGVNWSELVQFDEAPLQASLGDEEVMDDLAKLEFAGEVEVSQESPSKQLQKLQTPLPVSDAGWLNSSLDDVWQNVPGGATKDPEGEGSGLLLKVPKNGLAVTKGSFTAFTIPAFPRANERYSIVIEVRLPAEVKKYRVNDLSGKVVGSDGYEQKLPYDSRTPGAAGYPTEGGKVLRLEASTMLDVIDNKVQIVISVPGGKRMVKDAITIRSRRLKEEQELELVFGKAPPTDDDEPEMKE